jgi:hypothetical protein
MTDEAEFVRALDFLDKLFGTGSKTGRGMASRRLYREAYSPRE